MTTNFSQYDVERFCLACYKHNLGYSYSSNYDEYKRGYNSYMYILDLSAKIPKELARIIWNARVDSDFSEKTSKLAKQFYWK